MSASAMGDAAAGDLPVGDIEFYDNVLPPLVAGDYVIDVQQSVSGDGIDATTYTHDQRMQVAGPHFGLAAGDVFSMYPPNGSTADYTESLPSIVFSRRNLPWQIWIAGPTTGPVVAPWLALLLLTPEEIVAPAAGTTASPTGAQTVRLADYLTPPAGTVGPAFTAQQVQEFEAENPPDFTTTVVDVDPGAFTAVAPQLGELPYLAHARRVDTGDQEILGVEADGWFSVVIGNRFAQGSATGAYVVHLVSLEGFSTVLPPAALPTGTTAVRLVSLASWTFNGLTSAGDFAGLMRNLDVGMLTMPALLPNPQTAQEKLVTTALGGGYTALDYQTRLGERTVGWYRGPCLPVQMEHNPQPPYRTAESAMVYDSATGIFDLSFSVAWQTGRLMMLANRQVVVALLRWLRKQHHTSQLLLERLGLVASYGSLGLPDDVGSLLEPSAPRRTVAAHLAARVAPRLRPGDAAPLGPPTDPSGLLRHLSRLPGVVPPADAARLAADGADPARAVLDHVRSTRRRAGRGEE